MRRRYQAPMNYPLQPNPGGWGVGSSGAALPSEGTDRAEIIPKISEPGPSNLIIPRPFDHIAIVTAPASGTTTWLIGDNANIGTVTSAPVPLGMRGVVTGIFPYLEGGSGPVRQARIAGAGVTITWSVCVNGRPDANYGAVQTILAPWDSAALSSMPLMYLRPGEQLTCNVTNTDPSGLYGYLGVRIVGRWELLYDNAAIPMPVRVV